MTRREPPQPAKPTMRIRIGRLVLDGRIATGSHDAIGEAIQTELASLMSDGAASTEARGPAPTSLAGSIAAGISARLNTMSVRAQPSSSPPSPGTAPRVTHG